MFIFEMGKSFANYMYIYRYIVNMKMKSSQLSKQGSSTPYKYTSRAASSKEKLEQ